MLVNGFINRGEAVVEEPDDEGEPAIQIEEVTLDGYSYMGNSIYLSVSVETNEPFDEVNYYLNGTWIGASAGDGEKTEVAFSSYPDGGEGKVTGVTYNVLVDVWREHDNGFFTQDSSTQKITIYTPISESTPVDDLDLLFVSGYVEISKQTYDFDSGYMSFDYDVYAGHCGEEADGDVTVITEYKASFPDLPDTENKRGPTNRGKIKPEDGERTFPDPGFIGTTLEGGVPGDPYDGEAYVRLVVSGKDGIDDYFLNNFISDCRHP